MAVIKITNFGGIAPSMDPRNLSTEGAQTAHNLTLRYGDFRPLKGVGAAVASAESGSKSIFRTPSGVWLSSTNDVDYVNAQINDAESERVYLTGRMTYPESWEAGVYRRLGVPSASTAPSVSVITNDEFTQIDSDAAQEAALAAAIAAVTAEETPIELGNNPPPDVPEAVITDPMYSKVQLHLQFNALTGGVFTDSSQDQREIIHDSVVALGDDNTGPLATAGAGYASFSATNTAGLRVVPGVDYTNRFGVPWTVDFWYTSDVELDFLSIYTWDYLVRKVAASKPSGGDQTLFCEYNYTTNKYVRDLTIRRPNGASTFMPGVPTFISVQNTGMDGPGTMIFIDGEFAGNTFFPLGSRLSRIGAAWDLSNQGLTGKMDEFRFTLGVRYGSVASSASNFTRPTTPFGTAELPSGFWIDHGEPLATGLATTTSRDAAYIVPLTLSGGTYITTNPADEYLRQGVLNGGQITYDGATYWAVVVTDYQTVGAAVDEGDLATAFAALDNPATPGTPLLTPTQAAELASGVADLYDPTKPPALTYMIALRAAIADMQAALVLGQGSSNATTAASNLAAKIALVTETSAAVAAYYEDIDATVSAYLATEAGGLFGDALPTVVERIVETRAYIVTFVTDRDEESAPSPPSELVTLDQNDEATVTSPVATPDRYIVGWRLYRSSTSNAGAAYQLVEDKVATNAVLEDDGSFKYFSLDKLTYLDAKAQEELQETCPTLTWSEPPENLIGLVGLPNGIMAGFFGKTLCFSEPYAPYAWPVDYQQTLEYDIVGIGVFGQTAVALTAGNPYYVSGADSASMSAQKLESPQSCIVKRTIAASEGGVMWASPDGLCLAAANGVSVFTLGAFSRDDWQAEVGPGSFGAFHEGVYYLFT